MVTLTMLRSFLLFLFCSLHVTFAGGSRRQIAAQDGHERCAQRDHSDALRHVRAPEARATVDRAAHDRLQYPLQHGLKPDARAGFIRFERDYAVQ